MLFNDPRTIFNALAENYDAYRPHYPSEALLFLVTLAELDRSSTVADLGSGTGRLALALAPYVRLVYALDPARQMLRKLEENARSEGITGIQTIEAEGEDTGLPTDSIDLVTLAQSFHWMNKERAVRETSRILKPHQPLVLLWNRSLAIDDEYYQQINDCIAQFNPKYAGGEDIISADFPDAITESGLFHKPERYTFPFSIEYTSETYIGFLLSKSYVGAGIKKDRLPEFMTCVHEILHEHFGGNRFTENYETVVLAARSIE
jgi:ubiquinone/menaquinone biosynthesis C-methylase UbiE